MKVLSGGYIQQSLSRKSNIENNFVRGTDISGDLSPFFRPPQPCCNQILVVDDNIFNVKSLTLILQHCFNLDCDTVSFFLLKFQAYSGEDAIRLVRLRMNKIHKFGCREIYPLILTDINMPEMDGLQMTKIIRQLI